jgi:hypothetical protein
VLVSRAGIWSLLVFGEKGVGRAGGGGGCWGGAGCKSFFSFSLVGFRFADDRNSFPECVLVYASKL